MSGLDAGGIPSIAIDPTSPIPPYEQIRAQIALSIGAGILSPRALLPSVRQLGGDLGVAPNTVVRAYGELEKAGWIVAVPRRGFIVAPSPPTMSHAERDRLLTVAVDTLLQTARRLGVSEAELRAAIDRALQPHDLR